MSDIALKDKPTLQSNALKDVKLILRQVGYEQKSYWRNPLSAFFTFVFPLVLFVIFNSIFGDQNIGTDSAPIHGVDYYTPSILAYAVMSSCFLGIAMQYVQRREFGIFKRMRGTPLPAWALVGGTLGNNVVIAGIQTVLCLVLAKVAYNVDTPPSHLIPVVVTVLLAAIAFSAIGIAASSFIPNADAGPAVVNLPYFLLVFISGTYFPVHGGLAKVADWFPLRPFFESLSTAVQSPSSMSGWAGKDLLHLLIWGAVGAVVAARRFQWSPRRS